MTQQASILVSGLINIETTLKIDKFPIDYEPVRFPFHGINTTVSGVGYNISKALTTLGNQVEFLSLIGKDAAGRLVLDELERDGISDEHIIHALEKTAQSVIIYNADGKRMINTDLKNIQELSYPVEKFEAALKKGTLAVLCNINFSRPLLKIASNAGVPVATDVHTISDLDDPYNREFMAAADILFMSDELLPVPPEEWIREVQRQFNTPVIVIGLGDKGALMAVRDENYVALTPAVSTRPVVNTIGAGDALFSAFVHTYHQTQNPFAAIEQAVVFAGYKIGGTGAAEGFLSAPELEKLTQEAYK